MKKFDLLRKDDRIIRVLEMKPDRVLVIDCIKRTMPVWVEASVLKAFSDCTMEDLYKTELIHSFQNFFSFWIANIIFIQKACLTTFS